MPLMIREKQSILCGELFNLYEKRLQDELGLSPKDIEHYERDIAPIVYLSILNKKVSNQPRHVYVSKDFNVPEPHIENWLKLKKIIESGGDLSGFLCRGTNNWAKSDYLLFSCNIAHLHITSKKGLATNKELVFGVFKDDAFYAIYFGDHNDMFKAKEFVDIAHENWENQLFEMSEEKGSNFYNPRLAMDVNSQFNLVTPTGQLKGHQHTNLATMQGGLINVRSVPQHLITQYNWELGHLKSIERFLYSMLGVGIDLLLDIDFAKQRYHVEVVGRFDKLVFPFFKYASCSKTVSQKYL